MEHETLPAHSEQAIVDEIVKLSDAGCSVIQIRTRESVRTATSIRKGILAEDTHFLHNEWDIINGWRRFTLENYTQGFMEGDNTNDIFPALMAPLANMRDPASQVNLYKDRVHFYVYVNPHPYIRGNPIAAELIQQYAALLPAANICMVFVTPDIDLGDLPLGTVMVADMPTPSVEELEQSLWATIDTGTGAGWADEPEVTEDDVARIARLGMGMTKYEFEAHASLAIVNASINGDPAITAEALTKGIAAGKTEVVKQSEMLELFHPEDMGDVGGMHRLKDWVSARRECFTDDAAEFGIESPKGIALIGVPGAGKSLVAKAVAGAWGVPLIRLDFGAVFSKYVGESEQRMRAALNMVSQMGRLVLFADEIDKGLAGAGGGSNDSGISSRVLGSFLTWMQENTSNVFVIMTANRVQGLPPELFRRGRLDAVFSVTMPNGDEREEVLGVHLRKRKRSIDAFSAQEIITFREASQGYVPAEIESAVKDALLLAYRAEDRELRMSHIIESLKGMVPQSVSHKPQIDAIVAWAAENATPVSYPEGQGAIASNVSDMNSRRIARRPRTPKA